MIIAGIDPGASGAIAFIDTSDWMLEVYDIPHLKVPVAGKMRKTVDVPAFAAILQSRRIHLISTEDLHSRPMQDVRSIFSLGRYCGQIDMAGELLADEIMATDPKVWKRVLGLTSDKALSVARCTELIPASAPLFKFNKDHDRAEAVLLGFYACLKKGIVPETISLKEYQKTK